MKNSARSVSFVVNCARCARTAFALSLSLSLSLCAGGGPHILRGPIHTSYMSGVGCTAPCPNRAHGRRTACMSRPCCKWPLTSLPHASHTSQAFKVLKALQDPDADTNIGNVLFGMVSSVRHSVQTTSFDSRAISKYSQHVAEQTLQVLGMTRSPASRSRALSGHRTHNAWQKHPLSRFAALSVVND